LYTSIQYCNWSTVATGSKKHTSWNARSRQWISFIHWNYKPDDGTKLWYYMWQI